MRHDEDRQGIAATPGLAAPESPPGADHTLVADRQAGLQVPLDVGRYLVVRGGVSPGLRIEIDERQCLVGRAEDCQLRLPEPTVSSQHCRVHVAGDELWVEDLGSTNGTFLDGERLSVPARVAPGSVLQVGSQVLHYEKRSRHDVAQAERLAGELARACAYVEALLPARLDAGDVRCDWCFVPSAVLGGDAFGYHRIAGDRLAIYLIDVCGHGAAAALHSVSVINTIRRQTLVGVDFGDPASVLTELNSVFPMDDHDGMFFSAWYGVWCPETRLLSYASAGHPPALLVTSAAGAPVSLATRGPGVGAIPGTCYGGATTSLPAGSTLYVYSDGIFEFKTKFGVRWTYDAFLGLVAGRTGDAAGEVARLREEVWQVAGTQAMPDDLSLVVFDFV